jgi:hypothetical protein
MTSSTPLLSTASGGYHHHVASAITANPLPIDSPFRVGGNPLKVDEIFAETRQ